MAAKLPHQGRVLISGLPFHGEGYFGFALISEAGDIIWNHEGDLAKEPSGSLPIAVEQGFYAIELGNPGINGMSDIPDGIFEDNPRVNLRIWFDDGTNGREQLGKDQPLLVAPYALSSQRPD